MRYCYGICCWFYFSSENPILFVKIHQRSGLISEHEHNVWHSIHFEWNRFDPFFIDHALWINTVQYLPRFGLVLRIFRSHAAFGLFVRVIPRTLFLCVCVSPSLSLILDTCNNLEWMIFRVRLENKNEINNFLMVHSVINFFLFRFLLIVLLDFKILCLFHHSLSLSLSLSVCRSFFLYFTFAMQTYQSLGLLNKRKRIRTFYNLIVELKMVDMSFHQTTQSACRVNVMRSMARAHNIMPHI